MSHQTGIAGSEHLRNFFARAKNNDSIRLVKVSIVDEKLVLAHSDECQSSWDADLDDLILPLLESSDPCYVLYRLDSRNQQGYEWLFMSYSPDTATVRQKMLYAATRATLKQEFGGGHIKHDIFASIKEELSLSGYEKFLASLAAPAPLTMAEEELKLIHDNEVNTSISVDSKHQTMTGVAFPLSNQAKDVLRNFKEGECNYVQLSLDLQKEVINVEEHEEVAICQLASHVPGDRARYHFYCFRHSHEGDYQQANVFIYSMPGYKCSIRERMLYSSCKSSLLDTAEQTFGIEISKKLEVDDGKELSEEFLRDEIHPQKNVARQAFSKPKGPIGRGPRRLTKPK